MYCSSCYNVNLQSPLYGGTLLRLVEMCYHFRTLCVVRRNVSTQGNYHHTTYTYICAYYYTDIICCVVKTLLSLPSWTANSKQCAL